MGERHACDGRYILDRRHTWSFSLTFLALLYHWLPEHASYTYASIFPELPVALLCCVPTCCPSAAGLSLHAAVMNRIACPISPGPLSGHAPAMLRPMSRQIRVTCLHVPNWPIFIKRRIRADTRWKAGEGSVNTHIPCHRPSSKDRFARLSYPQMGRSASLKASTASHLPYAPLVYRQQRPDLEIFKQTNQKLAWTLTIFFVTGSPSVPCNGYRPSGPIARTMAIRAAREA